MRQIIFKKSYIIYTLLILFSFTIIPTTDTSALSYQTDVGVSFTFNPTLSVSISPSDLTISNLTPGTTDTSNEISVNVSTNNVYGYNLYATVGNSTYDNTSLTRSGSNGVFASISTTASFTDLTDFTTNAADNTWGYTYSLDNGTTWSNYNGLPLYTTDNPTRLKKNTGPAEDTVNFKIAAKSSSTQLSGTYTNIINFTAVTKPTPVTLADAYISEGKELYHGYYKMQDMTHTICEEVEDIGAQLQVIDIRDDKVYWIAKLADNNCWMTQNLDLDLTSNPNANNYIALTSENTDLTDTTSAAYQDGYTVSETGVITWVPERDTYTSIYTPSSDNWAGNTGDDATSGFYHPYSWNRVANSNNDPVYPDSVITQVIAGNHAQSGNYYNWSSAIASNNTESFVGNDSNAVNSICPKGWSLPTENTYDTLYKTYKNIRNSYNLMNSPLWFIRSGFVNGMGDLNASNYSGRYWSSTTNGRANSIAYAYSVYLLSDFVNPTYGTDDRSSGLSLRCLAR